MKLVIRFFILCVFAGGLMSPVFSQRVVLLYGDTSLLSQLRLKLNKADTIGLDSRGIYSFTKNATNDSLYITLKNGTVFKVKDSIGSGSGIETDPIVKAINGIVKSNGSLISAAVAGTDYLTPSGSAAALTSFPTLNQNTTGSAAILTTPRNIQGVAFDGSSNIDIINGTGFVKSSGSTLSYDNSTYNTFKQTLAISFLKL